MYVINLRLLRTDEVAPPVFEPVTTDSEADVLATPPPRLTAFCIADMFFFSRTGCNPREMLLSTLRCIDAVSYVRICIILS